MPFGRNNRNPEVEVGFHSEKSRFKRIGRSKNCFQPGISCLQDTGDLTLNGESIQPNDPNNSESSGDTLDGVLNEMADFEDQTAAGVDGSPPPVLACQVQFAAACGIRTGNACIVSTC